MHISYTLNRQQYTFQNIKIELLEPMEEELHTQFLRKKNDCPYWGQVWPAAIGLSQYLVENPAHIKNLEVLEIAGGLGLPSLVAAHFAKSVCCSDYMEEAVKITTESSKINQYKIATEVIDWNHIPEDKKKEVVLLSDINYEPKLFVQLNRVITDLLAEGTKIILSTPQRLMAKPFIESILPFVIEQAEIPVINKYNIKEWVNVYVLKNNISHINTKRNKTTNKQPLS